MQQQIKVFASFCKNIAPSRWGHRGLESRHVKFFTRISRENKIYTNMDLAIPLGLEFRESDRYSGTTWVQIPPFMCFYHCKYHIFLQF